MPDYTVPDRQLGELWALSDHLVAAIREDTATLRAQVATWEPAPYPKERHR